MYVSLSFRAQGAAAEEEEGLRDNCRHLRRTYFLMYVSLSLTAQGATAEEEEVIKTYFVDACGDLTF
jgi:hypothetical protein